MRTILAKVTKKVAKAAAFVDTMLAKATPVILIVNTILIVALFGNAIRVVLQDTRVERSVYQKSMVNPALKSESAMMALHGYPGKYDKGTGLVYTLCPSGCALRRMGIVVDATITRYEFFWEQSGTSTSLSEVSIIHARNRTIVEFDGIRVF